MTNAPHDFRRQELLLDADGVLVTAALVQHEFGRAAMAVGHERDLGIDDLQEVVARAFRKDLEDRLTGELDE